MCPLHELTTCPCPPNHTCADIILSDIDLPHIGGMEFIADQRKKGCKVKNFALMSGGWSIDELDQVATLDYKIFHKPFGFEELNNWFLECEKRIDPNRKLYNLF
jgi:two-component SAPR family response regulator